MELQDPGAGQELGQDRQKLNKSNRGGKLNLDKAIQSTTENDLDKLGISISLDRNNKESGTLNHDAGKGYASKNS